MDVPEAVKFLVLAVVKGVAQVPQKVIAMHVKEHVLIHAQAVVRGGALMLVLQLVNMAARVHVKVHAEEVVMTIVVLIAKDNVSNFVR